jgi:hypothetical protein
VQGTRDASWKIGLRLEVGASSQSCAGVSPPPVAMHQLPHNHLLCFPPIRGERLKPINLATSECHVICVLVRQGGVLQGPLTTFLHGGMKWDISH